VDDRRPALIEGVGDGVEVGEISPGAGGGQQPLPALSPDVGLIRAVR
jgi:hypothetical protein